MEYPENWDKMSIEAKGRFLELKEAQLELAGKGGREPRYGEILGGLGWPTGARPGYIVVIGEKNQHFYVLDHYSDFEVTNLLQKCVSLSKKWRIEGFYCDTNNKPMMDHVYRIQNRPNFTSPLLLGDPNELAGYMAIIRELTTPANKRLHFSGSPISARLLEVGAETVHGQQRAADFPLLQALGACLSSMIRYQMTPEEEAEMEHQMEMVDSLLSEQYDG